MLPATRPACGQRHGADQSGLNLQQQLLEYATKLHRTNRTMCNRWHSRTKYQCNGCHCDGTWMRHRRGTP
eukprot:6764587-Prorocentrum_lima.AAC.1